MDGEDGFLPDEQHLLEPITPQGTGQNRWTLADHSALNFPSSFHAIFSSLSWSLPTLDCRWITALTWSATLPLVATSTLPYEMIGRVVLADIVLMGKMCWVRRL
jgi:hypothetical protein